MSEQAAENAPEEVSLDLEAGGLAAFATLMDALVADEDGSSAGEAEPQAGADADGDGSAGAPAGAAAPGEGAAEDGAPGAAGDQGVPAGGVGADSGTPATWVPTGTGVGKVSFDSIAPKFGEMSTKLEEASLQARQRVAVAEVQEEYSKYFTALNLHPRRLVGQEVPSSTGDGMETLRTSEDAREWQDAIKDLLADEIRERAEQISEEDAATIKQGTVTASLILRKLGSYPRQNGLALALREVGRIERTLFILDWLQHKELRRRVQAGLNKGEARNALARAVFFNRLGEIRDRSFEQQRYRASGLNLLTAAIVLWNTVYIERAVNALREQGQEIDDDYLQYLSPLGWEHINLTGDYLWKSNVKVGNGKFRPLRRPDEV